MATTHASKHNEAMTFIFSNLESVPSENVEAVVAGIYDDFCTGNNLPWPFGPIYSPTFPENPLQIDVLGQIADSGKSEALKEAASQLIIIVQRELRYHDFDREIDLLTQNQGGNLGGDDAATFADMVSVARQSHQLYFSETGEATEFQLLAGSVPGGSGDDVLASVNWWKVLAVDVIGGMMGGPGGYLGASAIAVIMQL